MPAKLTSLTQASYRSESGRPSYLGQASQNYKSQDNPQFHHMQALLANFQEFNQIGPAEGGRGPKSRAPTAPPTLLGGFPSTDGQGYSCIAKPYRAARVLDRGTPQITVETVPGLTTIWWRENLKEKTLFLPYVRDDRREEVEVDRPPTAPTESEGRGCRGATGCKASPTSRASPRARSPLGLE